MQIDIFTRHILEAGVLVDPEGIHHEFYSGMHGQKADFDVIVTGTPLFKEWVDITEAFLRSTYNTLPEVVIGVANGANRLATATAKRFERMHGVTSKKEQENRKHFYLSKEALEVCGQRPRRVVILEDVSTTGGSSLQVAQKALAAGAQSVEVVTTLQRRPQLEQLAKAGILHHAIISMDLPTYSPTFCQESGFCAKGWTLVPHRSNILS